MTERTEWVIWQALLGEACRQEFARRGLATAVSPEGWEHKLIDETVPECAGNAGYVGVAFYMACGCVVSCLVSPAEREQNVSASQITALVRSKAEVTALSVEAWKP